MDERYSRVFLDTDLAHSAVLAETARVCGGKVDGWTIVAEPFELDVRPNDDAHKFVDFLGYPFTVEVVAQGVSVDDYISFLSRLMMSLYKRGMSVVAASDWEADLPGGGRLVQQRSER